LKRSGGSSESYQKLREELRVKGAYKKEMFEKLNAAREAQEIAKKLYFDMVYLSMTEILEQQYFKTT
jgi:hypothetical protein